MSKWLDNTGLSYLWSKIKAAFLGKTDPAYATKSIFYGQVDETSTSTAYTATIPGLTELRDGVCVMLKNGVVTSAAGFTININGLGAKPSYNNMAAATADTTLFNVNYTMLFVYDSTRGGSGGWICYRGYDANTNTIGYQMRTNSALRVAADKGYRYRLWFKTLDGKYAPANLSTSTNATAARTPNPRVIDPFGEIVYAGSSSAINGNANLSATTCWTQYTLTLGYSFNTTGAALTLINPAPVYLKCTPASGGGATMDGIVQALPSSADGKIYIYLGEAYNATNIELVMCHPVYEYKDGAIRLYTNAAAGGGGSSVTPATAAPLMDGTATVGSSTKYAREDHIHPRDTQLEPFVVDFSKLDSQGLPTQNWSMVTSVTDYLTAVNSGRPIYLHMVEIDTSATLHMYRRYMTSGYLVEMFSEVILTGTNSIQDPRITGATVQYFMFVIDSSNNTVALMQNGFIPLAPVWWSSNDEGKVLMINSSGVAVPTSLPVWDGSIS